MVIALLIAILPDFLRIPALRKFKGWSIGANCKISRLSFVSARSVTLGPGVIIGALTVIKGIEALELGENAIIGRLNWISGYPLSPSGSFSHVLNRDPSLRMGRESAITNRHIIDCTDLVRIGAFATVAGYNSQLLTHSIDIPTSRQSCKPIVIGEYCFIGTRAVILGGAEIAPNCIVGAGSVVAAAMHDEWALYGGIPAKKVKSLNGDEKYMSRTSGVVE